MKILIFLLISYCSSAQNTATVQFINKTHCSKYNLVKSYRETSYEQIDFKKFKSGELCIISPGKIRFRDFDIKCVVTLFNSKKEIVMKFSTEIGKDYGLYLNAGDWVVIETEDAIKNNNKSIFP